MTSSRHPSRPIAAIPFLHEPNSGPSVSDPDLQAELAKTFEVLTRILPLLRRLRERVANTATQKSASLEA